MREDNAATEIANSLSECLNACAMLCLKMEVQRDAVLDAVSWFIEAAPLSDLPTVWSSGNTKDMTRNAAAVAAKMQPLVLAWDGTTEPPRSLLSLAHEFLVSIGMEQLGIPAAGSMNRTPPIPASPASGEPPRMSIEEWAALPEDEPGELVDGCLVEEEMADYEHETVVSFVNAALRGWVVPRGGFIAGSEAKFAVGREQGRKPDLSVYLPGGSIPPRRGPLRVPPDIVIEVLSPTLEDARRDRVEKFRDYIAFGVHWYWLIAPMSRSLEIIELRQDQGNILSLVASQGSVTIPGCVDFTLDLDALWVELARLGPAAPEE